MTNLSVCVHEKLDFYLVSKFTLAWSHRQCLCYRRFDVDGCHVVKQTVNCTTCRCDHTASFVLFIRVTEPPVGGAIITHLVDV